MSSGSTSLLCRGRRETPAEGPHRWEQGQSLTPGPVFAAIKANSGVGGLDYYTCPSPLPDTSLNLDFQTWAHPENFLDHH